MIKVNIKKELNCSIETIWEIVTDNKNYSWRSDLSRIEEIDSTHFIEFTKNNYPTYFTITAKKRCNEYELAFENTNGLGKWHGLFKEQPNGNTELDFTEEIEANNILIKLLARFYLKKQQKRYFKDLEKEIKKVHF